MRLEVIRRSMVALVAGVVLLGAGALQAEEGGVDISACGHLEELEAGRDALAEGDRKEALRHLRAAREILIECESAAQAAASKESLPRLGRDLI